MASQRLKEAMLHGRGAAESGDYGRPPGVGMMAGFLAKGSVCGCGMALYWARAASANAVRRLTTLRSLMMLSGWVREFVLGTPEAELRPLTN